MRINIKRKLLTEGIDPSKYYIEYIEPDDEGSERVQNLGKYILIDGSNGDSIFIIEMTRRMWGWSSFKDGHPAGRDWRYSIDYGVYEAASEWPAFEPFRSAQTFSEKRRLAQLSTMFFETVLAIIVLEYGGEFLDVAETTNKVFQLLAYAERKSILTRLPFTPSPQFTTNVKRVYSISGSVQKRIEIE